MTSPDRRRPEQTADARRSPWIGAVQGLLTVLVTWFIVRRVGLSLDDLGEVGLEGWRPRWGLFGLSCGLLLTGYAVTGALWGRVARDLGARGLGTRAAVALHFVANLGRYVPGKLWHIAGLAVLARRHGVSPAVSTAAAVLGHALALGGATAVGALAILGGEGALGRSGWAFLAALAAGMVGLLVPGLQQRGLDLWFRLARSPEPASAVPPAVALRWIALYVANWALYASAFAVLAAAFGFPGAPLAAASAFAAAYVLGYAALFAPAGIGVREGFLTLFLAPSMGAGPAGALALTARLWTTGVELLPAAFFWVRLTRDSAGSRPAEVERAGKGA